MRLAIKEAKTWVVKLGSALLSDQKNGLNHVLIDSIAEQVGTLIKSGKKVILVSSGAIAEGMYLLDYKHRPKQINKLQALAATGQMSLIHAYESCFNKYDFHTAQILLTHAEMANRERYINAKSTLMMLLEMGVIPIINENDVITNEEIRFGDNDTLAALAVTLVEADVLLILTDQEGMFDANPTLNSNAKLLKKINPEEKVLDQMVDSRGGVLGSGGMLTKLEAARQCAKAGSHTIIASGKHNNVVVEVANGEEIGTWLVAGENPLAARKRWLLGQLHTCGVIDVDQGASDALKRGSSLLPAGVINIEGVFSRGDLVKVHFDGNEVARGLVNYNAFEGKRIYKTNSHDIEEILGYAGEEEIIHKDNLVLI